MTLYLGSTRVALTAVPTRFGATPATFIGDVDSNGVLQAPTSQTNLVFTGVQNIGTDGLNYTFAYSPVIKSVTFPDLTQLTKDRGLYYAFNGSSVESVSFPALTVVKSGGSQLRATFLNCTSLTSASFPALENFNAGSGAYSIFEGCSNLTGVSFPLLASIVAAYGFYAAFRGSGLTSVSFPVLSTLKGNQVFGYAFRDCTSLTSVSFPALTASGLSGYTTQFQNMLYGVTGCTVHFPCNLQTTIGSWNSVTSGFGGTNTTVLFDLPATN